MATKGGGYVVVVLYIFMVHNRLADGKTNRCRLRSGTLVTTFLNSLPSIYMILYIP